MSRRGVQRRQHRLRGGGLRRERHATGREVARGGGIVPEEFVSGCAKAGGIRAKLVECQRPQLELRVPARGGQGEPVGRRQDARKCRSVGAAPAARAAGKRGRGRGRGATGPEKAIVLQHGTTAVLSTKHQRQRG